MQLIQECTFAAALKPPLPIGPGPLGVRVYYEVAGGEVTGNRLRGKVLGGGEWALIGPDGPTSSTRIGRGSVATTSITPPPA